MDPRIDAALMPLAQQAGDIKGLLRVFFAFLHSRTDFYVEDENPKRPIGFAPGVAEELVLEAFRSFPFKDASGNIKGSTRTSKSVPAPKAPEPKPKAPETAPKLPKDRPSPPTVHLTPEGKQIPIGNGGVGPDGEYWWTQTLTDVTFSMPFPVGTRASDLNVDISSNHLQITLKKGDVVFDQDLGGTVDTEESTWTLDTGDSSTEWPTLCLTLEKTSEQWWRRFSSSCPEIDATKIDSSRPIDSYDSATQATIRRLVAEQSEKAKE